MNLATSEGGDLSVKLGEAYLDFENVSKLWHRENQLSIRLGRMDVPFGEEHRCRDAIDNPLGSHSVMDLWGVGSVFGIELAQELAEQTRCQVAFLADSKLVTSTLNDLTSDASSKSAAGG